MTILLINCYHKEHVQLQQINYDFTNPDAFFVHQEAEYYDERISSSQRESLLVEAPVSVVYTITGGEAPL